MSETTFSVKGNGVGKVRLESTDIIGIGSPANPKRRKRTRLGITIGKPNA
jgi:hypothetical protein